ncbi:MAG TPA: DUF2892 domain-containing protein [Streptosporangiaceae bacterium]|nr:DUF2892 domain-containing protein [Streptosporangiaceae bacterium]
MRRNEGAVDRWLRLILAALGWWLAASLGYGTAGGVIVLVVAGILVVTAVTGYCPLYALLRISTRGGHQVLPGSRRLHRGHPAR